MDEQLMSPKYKIVEWSSTYITPLTPRIFAQLVCEAIANGFLNNPFNEDLLEIDRDCSCLFGNPDRTIRIDPEIVEIVLMAIESTISRVTPRGRAQVGAELAWTLDAVIEKYDQPIKPGFVIGKGMLIGVDASGYGDFIVQNKVGKYSIPVWKSFWGDKVDNA